MSLSWGKRNIALIYRIPYHHTSLQPINSTFITLLPNCVQQISTEKTQLTSPWGDVNLEGQQSNYGGMAKKNTPHQVNRGKMVPLHKYFVDLELWFHSYKQNWGGKASNKFLIFLIFHFKWKNSTQHASAWHQTRHSNQHKPLLPEDKTEYLSQHITFI